MFAYIDGCLVVINPTMAVIDCGGLGYEINISLTTYSDIKDKVNAKAKLFLQHIVREDAQLLFGFSTMEEKNLFLKLISVSGVGANTARVILSTLSTMEASCAIINKDANKIQSVKGIGAKTAQRIIVDLCDKVEDLRLFENADYLNEKSINANKAREEALAALLMLGFVKLSSEKVLDNILSNFKDLNSEELIKTALRML